MRWARLCRLLSLLLILALPLGAETRILVCSSGTGADADIAVILERSLRLELEREGFSVVEERAGDEGAASLPRLDCRFDAAASRLSVALTLRDGSSGEILAGSAFDEGLSLDLDARVVEDLRAVMRASGLRAEVARPSRDAAAEDVAAAARAPSPQPALLALAPPLSAGAAPIETQVELPAPTPTMRMLPGPRAAQPLPAVPVIVPGEGAGTSFRVQAAPILVVGDASEYFSYGAEVAAFLGRAFSFQAFQLEAGFRVAASGVVPASSSADGLFYLGSAGIEARLALPAQGTFRLIARIGGGPSLLVAAPEAGSARAKLLPDCVAGLGLGFEASDSFSLEADIGLLVLFERGLPLFGLEPGIAASWRL